MKVRCSGGNDGGTEIEIGDDGQTDFELNGARYIVTDQTGDDGVRIATFAGMVG